MLFLAQMIHATHIVGGMVTYKYLGNKRYVVSFKVYRDCNGGQAAFDGDPTLPRDHSIDLFTMSFLIINQGLGWIAVR